MVPIDGGCLPHHCSHIAYIHYIKSYWDVLLTLWSHRTNTKHLLETMATGWVADETTYLGMEWGCSNMFKFERGMGLLTISWAAHPNLWRFPKMGDQQKCSIFGRFGCTPFRKSLYRRFFSQNPSQHWLRQSTHPVGPGTHNWWPKGTEGLSPWGYQ